MKKLSNKYLKTLTKELKRIRGVTYIDYGYKIINGNMNTDRLAIRVHVIKKREKSELHSEEIIPKEIHGIETDVIENVWVRNSIILQQRFINLQGGVQIINPKLQIAGTLGCVLFENGTGNLLGLTAAHNLTNGNVGTQGDRIYQPNLDTLNVNDFIGLSHSISKPLDAATILLNNSRNIIPKAITNGSNNFMLQGVSSPQMGMIVFKIGCATDQTTGVIDGVGPDEKFTISTINDPVLSDFGDSGAIWVDTQTGHGVGLHIEGNPITKKRALASSLSKIMKALHLVPNHH